MLYCNTPPWIMEAEGMNPRILKGTNHRSKFLNTENEADFSHQKKKRGGGGISQKCNRPIKKNFTIFTKVYILQCKKVGFLF